MSQVKIQGNASGTRQFTIAAPNSNSNYTFTLPTETGTVLTNTGPYTASSSATAGAVTIDASNNVGIGTGSPLSASGYTSVSINGTTGGRVDLYANSTRVGAFLCTSSGVQVSTITATPLIFNTNTNEAARIESGGNVLIGTTSTNGVGISFVPQVSLGAPYITLNKSYNGGATAIGFSYNGGSVGSISYTNTATAYNTSSDYRLKEDVQPMTGALAKVAALRPVIYKWKADGSNSEGFIAHELQAVVPDCVTGEKDAVDADGNPVYQGIDTSFLVATLTAAIQELSAKVDAQAAEIAALKGAA